MNTIDTQPNAVGQALAAVALMLALSNESATAASITVDGTICTLADAITAANTDTAIGGCVSGIGIDILVLNPGSTHTLTSVDNDTHGPTGLPVISSEIIIVGNDATIERHADAPEFRIIVIDESGQLRLEQTSVTGGIASGAQGGGVYSMGDLMLDGCAIFANSAENGGGVFADSSSLENSFSVAYSTVSGNTGGGIWARAGFGSGNDITITDSTISDNIGYGIATSFMFATGGTTITGTTITRNSERGIDTFYWKGGNGTLTLSDSIVSDNGSDGIRIEDNEAGGIGDTIDNTVVSGNAGVGVDIYVVYGARNVTITNSTISANSGGIDVGYNFDGAAYLTVVGSTISANSSSGVELGGNGGGYISLTLANSTISGNSAARGGGVYAIGGDFTITDSTITGNLAAGSGGGMHIQTGTCCSGDTFRFNRSIVAGNTALSGAEVFIGTSGFFTVIADNFNLFGANGDAGVVGFSPGPGDIVPAPGVMLSDILDPVLGDNGGPTWTHALVDGSLARDAVPAIEPDCGGTDQRGVQRPQDGNADGVSDCDVGAYEFTEFFDRDNDGVIDTADNCVDSANPDQRDTDGDSIGNACDPDIAVPNDCRVNFADLGVIREAFFSVSGDPAWNPDADFNGDDTVNFADLELTRSLFFAAPGPSGITSCENEP